MSIFDWYRRAQYSVGLGEHPAIRAFKKRAKEIQGYMPGGSSLMRAQEHVAREHGFNNWHHAQQVANAYSKLSVEPKSAMKDRHRQVVKGANYQELKIAGARWLGYDALGGHHLGQSPSLECTHTLVIGDELGRTYFTKWLDEHIQHAEPFLAWVNSDTWWKWGGSPDFLNSDFNNGPLIVRFNRKDESWSGANVSIHWDALSELQAWVNNVAPHLVESSSEQQMLEAMLAWIWDCAEGQDKTGPLLATFLAPEFLKRFPLWSVNPHAALMLAGDVAVWLRAAQPFLYNDGKPVVRLSVREWLTYPKGIIVLDSDSPEQAAGRACLQSWLKVYVGHCLGMPLMPRTQYVLPGTRERTCHWYFANVVAPRGLSAYASQCRALRIGLTIFSSTLDNASLEVRANSYTRLTQSSGSSTHAVLEIGGNPVPSFTVDVAQRI